MEILYPPPKKWGKNAMVTETNAFASVISEPNAVTCRISDFGGWSIETAYVTHEKKIKCQQIKGTDCWRSMGWYEEDLDTYNCSTRRVKERKHGGRNIWREKKKRIFQK